MSLFFRASPAPEERAITSLPWVQGGVSPASTKLGDELSLVPVFAAVRLITDAISTLPLQAFRKAGSDRIRIPLPALFEGSSQRTQVEWLSQCVSSLLLRGNAFGLIVGTGDGSTVRATDLMWLNPTEVEWSKVDGTWKYEGRPIPAGEVLHIPGLILPGARLGVSPLTACRSVVETGKSVQGFMHDWHETRGVPSATFKNTERDLEPTAAEEAQARVAATMRAGKPFVLGKPWELTMLSLPADDAGFVQSARLTATQIAAIYGIPAEMIGGESAGSLTYSTVEMNQINFLTNTLRPWVTRIETALSTLMANPRYVRFNMDAAIRVDTKTRWDIAQIARNIGAKNVDEIRALEELPPLPNGDGQDYTPLKMPTTTGAPA